MMSKAPPLTVLLRFDIEEFLISTSTSIVEVPLIKAIEPDYREDTVSMIESMIVIFKSPLV